MRPLELVITKSAMCDFADNGHTPVLRAEALLLGAWEVRVTEAANTECMKKVLIYRNRWEYKICLFSNYLE